MSVKCLCDAAEPWFVWINLPWPEGTPELEAPGGAWHLALKRADHSLHLQWHNTSWYVHDGGNNTHYFCSWQVLLCSIFVAFMNLLWSFKAVLRYCSCKQSQVIYLQKGKDYSWKKIVVVNSWIIAIRADKKISGSVMCKQVLEKERPWRSRVSHTCFCGCCWGGGMICTHKFWHWGGSSAGGVLTLLQGAVCEHRNAGRLVPSLLPWGMAWIIYKSCFF